MISFKKILIPTDFSKIAKEALDYAFELASIHHAQLDVLHVFEEPAFPSFYGAGALMVYGKVPDIKDQALTALPPSVTITSPAPAEIHSAAFVSKEVPG